MVFEKTDDRDSLSEALAPYERVDRTNLHPQHLLVYHYKSLHDLVNYARAHSSLWLHTEVSSMNNLMIPLGLGGGPKEKQASPRNPRCLNPPRCVLGCHLR